MEDKNINSTIGKISKKAPKLSVTEVFEASSPIKTASDAISNSTIALAAARNLITPISQMCKMSNYIQIAKIPNLYVPRINYLAEKINDFQNNIKQIYTNIDDTCSILAEYNYLLPLTLPIHVYSDLLAYLKNVVESDNRAKEIDKLLLKLFSHKKWEMASDIVNKLHENNKINPKRIVILEDCIKVLRRNSRRTAANTILPVLITQIEGIWVDIHGAKDKNKLKNIVKDMKNDKYTNPARELLTDILFQYTKMELPVKSNFCRNKILHGEEVEYGSIYNVIRAFLIIEFLDFIEIDDELAEKATI